MGASWTKILAHNIRKHGRPSSLLKAFNSYSIWTQVWLRVNDKTQANTPEGTQDRTANSTSAGRAGRCGRGQTPPGEGNGEHPRKRGGARQPWLRAQATLTPTASPVWAGKEWNAFSRYDWRGKSPQVLCEKPTSVLSVFQSKKQLITCEHTSVGTLRRTTALCQEQVLPGRLACAQPRCPGQSAPSGWTRNTSPETLCSPSCPSPQCRWGQQAHGCLLNVSVTQRC